MNTDRELLEKAAKAAGYDYNPENWMNLERLELGIDSLNIPSLSSAWNPLESNGNAFRLMCDLKLMVDTDNPDSENTVDVTDIHGNILAVVPHGDDICSATRRAITLAAARIGDDINEED